MFTDIQQGCETFEIAFIEEACKKVQLKEYISRTASGTYLQLDFT